MKKCLSLFLALVLMLALTLPAMAADGDFVIEDGILTKYNGSGGDVVIPAGVTAIGEEAFSGCYKLYTLTIPSSVKSIGAKAFENCNGMTDVTIPSGVERIGDAAFKFCSRLSGMTIPSSVKSIGAEGFFGCGDLKNVTIPAGLTELGTAAFANTGVTEFTVADANPAFRAVDGILFDRAGKTLVQFPMGRSGEYAIPAGVERIGDYAFYSCFTIQSVTIPSSVTDIGDLAFCSCNAMKHITIPGTVKRIGKSAFANTLAMESITICDGVETIGEYMFYQCGAKSVTIPGSVKQIPEGAFNMSGVKEVTLCEGVQSIGDFAFCLCNGMTGVTIPDSVTEIGAKAFMWCTSLQGVTLPKNLKSIGDEAFKYCCVKDTVLSDSVTSVGKEAFSNSSMTSLKLSAGLTVIGDSMFAFNQLKELKIPEGVTEIGNGSFGFNMITDVEIPVSVQSIGDGAFRTTQLKDIWYAGAEAQWNSIRIGANDNDYLSAVTVHYLSTMPEKPAPVETGFADVDGTAYYAAAVKWAAEHEPLITNGTGKDAQGNAVFSPEATVQRGQAVTFLWRAAGCPEPEKSDNPFADVKESDYFYKAVLWAVEKGITNGTKLNDENGQSWFTPNGTLPYDQMLTFMCRASGGTAARANWSEAALNWAAENGLSEGLTITAKGECPRADVVYFLWRQMA